MPPSEDSFRARPRKVIVIGAGFAGLTAARELEGAGIDVTIYEARDRIGGRAWTHERLGGHALEMGATWVHWMQPFVWTEITRYAQEIYPSPDIEKAYWVSNGTVFEGTEHDLDEALTVLQDKIFEGSRAFFPYPHDPLWVMRDESAGTELRERFLKADTGSVLDCLRNGEHSQEQIDLADSYWSAAYQGPTATASPLMAKHWASLSDHRSSLMDEQTLRFKLVKGMRGLYTAIAGDLRTEIKLNAPVQRIEHGADGARVTLEDGTTDSADAVVVTVPIGALRHVDFAPALPESQQEVVREGSNSIGFKIWIKVEGHHSIIAGAPGRHPISLMRSEKFLDDENATILVGFGSDHRTIDLEDVASAQRAVDVWRPDLKVVDCGGHDWVADKWSGQTWATLKSGQFFQGWSLFQESETRLRFAGADYASGWNGVVVDGAIEMGIKTARGLINEFRSA
ncbi:MULTISPECIES: NAD(P)/FAD-dependent oxidoreductase [unclassified Mycolicibacterium]|uniref:flavin monoamine oxidase family protein n=1 Tax=unclassified Mycolicibacterium TaxID=2636767 RepID=UPI0012DBEB81|nr:MULTISPECIES: NAD(P)/FAD-dependent oxidoreductase [unclassified Mycolicibacterium]MUL83515.1 FAD-dependent oxidoreductase [Mycolicibacterium sp. CBMA 329]MUL90506.1 FAD-dependent oxidoreductase [Mycolicibacterium sp. CBMA 331]MUM00478.1 FAD-dependent oxidoreductase [Mycolicibacterium sp. CBMA 334]MUM27716.1 FAD-dependent oxidoreductase [Mycolicibacterium sp. CBMA 295]MUM41450.1 FAD-dependent oxidoreductase [Mycolicibacterium sp. CBMA 247]